jgi:TusA-related sulfurtransferase
MSLPFIDLREYECPMTMVILKASLEELPSAGLVDVALRGRDTLRDLTKTLRVEGWRITNVSEQAGEEYILTLERQLPAKGEVKK